MKARDVLNAIIAWSQVHTIAAAIIGGAVLGWLAGKLL